MMLIDKGSETRWSKSNISFKNYQQYINAKGKKRFELSLIDLLYISNFKGGNGTISENYSDVQNKLKVYSKKLSEINETFVSKKLSDLDDKGLGELTELVDSVVALTDKKCPSKIDGFGPSYLSALLASYFPKLIPILDRRVLINLRIVKKADRYANDQIRNIEKFYAGLIRELHEISKDTSICLRCLDKYLFIIKLNTESLEK